MTPPSKVGPNELWLARYTDDEDRGYYQANDVTYAQLAQFIRKLTIGDATKDSDDYISSYIMGNFTGGGQVEDLNEGAEADRFYYAFADTTAANRNALGPLFTAVRPNSNCSNCYPLEVGNDGWMYVAFNESGTWQTWGFNESTGQFDGAKDNLTGIPVGKAVRFHGRIYVPMGSNGYCHITGSAGTPTVTNVAGSADPTTAAPTSAPRPVAFTIFHQRLYAITATGGIAYHTITQADAGANAWTWDTALTTTDFPHIETSATPKNAAVFPDKNGVESIYVKTTRGLLLYDDNASVFNETHVEFPPHPDINQSLCIWPPGGDLHAGIGLNDVKYSTAFVADPHFGLARDHGLPPELRGAIVDLEPTVDRLYAVVGGVTETTTALVYDSKFGADGSGDGQLNTPGQVALDSSGNIYVADTGNNRLQKFNSSGVYQAKVTGLTGITGVCVDSSGNVYIIAGTSINKYNSSLVLQWSLNDASGSLTHCATDGTYLYYASSAPYIGRVVIANGTFTGFLTWGTSGTGDGQFNTPYGVAYNPVTGTVFVVDSGNDRVQEFTTGGVFVRKWGTPGTGNGQFNIATGVACHPTTGNVYVLDGGRDDGQNFTPTGSFIRTFGSAGTGNGQFAAPLGIAVNSSGQVWVSDTQAGDDRIQKFIESTSSASLTAYPSLHVWTGVGWHGLYRHPSNSVLPTFMKAGAATSGYRLWIGMTDGFAYHTKLRRTFHNARTGYVAGVDQFSLGGANVSEIVTGWFDAAMQGFDKIASHLIFLDAVATDDEVIDVEFKVDGGGWESLGSVTRSGETILPFDLVDDFSEGRRFNKIAFRFILSRGGNSLLTPVMDAAVLHFTKIPQNTTSFTLTVSLSPYKNRTAFEQYNDLTALVTTGKFLPLVFRRDSFDSDENEVSATFRVLIAAISGTFDTGEAGTGTAELSLIALPTGA